ncbi:hypothetical protein [Spirosoma spitsbergense]|nr:hypothetical protein [Spirosoma spitsbergense]
MYTIRVEAHGRAHPTKVGNKAGNQSIMINRLVTRFITQKGGKAAIRKY